MQESATIWYRGADYQLGRGEHGYAIWAAGGPPGQPLEQWPQTPAGWSAAWSRFNAVEAPGSIVHLGPPAFAAPTAPVGPASGPTAHQVSGPPAAPGSWRPAAGPVPPGAGPVPPMPGSVPPGAAPGSWRPEAALSPLVSAGPGRVPVRRRRSPRS